MNRILGVFRYDEKKFDMDGEPMSYAPGVTVLKKGHYLYITAEIDSDVKATLSDFSMEGVTGAVARVEVGVLAEPQWMARAGENYAAEDVFQASAWFALAVFGCDMMEVEALNEKFSLAA